MQDRLKHTELSEAEIKPKLGRKPQLATADEVKLVDHKCNQAQLGIGFDKKGFLRYAGDLTKQRKLAFKRGTLSLKWWRLMKKRHTDLGSFSPPQARRHC